MQHAKHVEEYLQTEMAHGAILGPFDDISSKLYHCSPLLTRPKPPDKRRVIVDLSFPRGNSVNDHIDKNKFDGYNFTLKLPTIDHITTAMKQFNDPVIGKIDISRAFRNLRVDPRDAMKIGISWGGQVLY